MSIKRIIKRFNLKILKRVRPVEQQTLAGDRIVKAAMHYARELARQKSKLTGTPAAIPAAAKAEPAPATGADDIHAENNAEIDRVIEQRRGNRMALTRHRKVIDFGITGCC